METDSEFLSWLADRLVHVYGENPNVDFVHATRRIAAALASPPSVPAGFMLVPIEPTPDMMRGVYFAGNSPEAIWNAMLTFAPGSPLLED